jgi:hypothetical protein
LRRRNYKRWLILGVLVLLLLDLFVFFGRHEVLPATSYTLVIQPGVSERSVQLVATGLEIADEFLRNATGYALAKPTEIRLASFTPCSPLEPLLAWAATAEVHAQMSSA